MRLLRDVLESWRHPRAVAARRIAAADERGLLGWLVLALLVAAAAGLAGELRTPPDADAPAEARVAARLMGGLVLAPLFFYALAGLSWLGLRLFGVRRADGRRARAALFWALLAASPALLLQSLLQGAGMAGISVWAGWLAAGAFLVFWAAGLSAVLRLSGKLASGERIAPGNVQN